MNLSTQVSVILLMTQHHMHAILICQICDYLVRSKLYETKSRKMSLHVSRQYTGIFMSQSGRKSNMGK